MPMLYKLCGEVMIPAINNSDIGAIFEEHRICKELGVFGPHQFHDVCMSIGNVVCTLMGLFQEDIAGVYGEKEKRFVFKSVIVGSSSKARVKIINPNKVRITV